MNSHTHDNESGVILVAVLVMLTLFEVVGMTFTFYAAERMCEAVATRDGTCTHDIGNDRP